MLSVPVAELGRGEKAKVIKGLYEQIREVEKKIKKLINYNLHLERIHEIMTFVDGLGKVTSS